MNNNIYLNEKSAIQRFCTIEKCQYTYVGKNVFSKIDGFLTLEDDIVGLFEVKCRNQSFSWFKDYKGAMISFHKIQIGSDLSRLLNTKFYVVIETSDKYLIVFQITDESGKIVCPMNIRYQEAEKTPTFDKKSSSNAYLSLSEENKYCVVYDINNIIWKKWKIM